MGSQILLGLYGRMRCVIVKWEITHRNVCVCLCVYRVHVCMCVYIPYIETYTQVLISAPLDDRKSIA